MANTPTTPIIEVRAVVILRIPDLDTTELTALYTELNKIKELFGGDFDITTSPQTPKS